MSRRRRRKPINPDKSKRPKHSLLCYHPLSTDRVSGCSQYLKMEDFLEKYHLSRKNIETLLDSAHRYLYVQWFRHRYFIGIHSDSLENFKYYCMLERKSHPGKKGNRHKCIDIRRIEAINKEIYPFWVS
jgi:hypothetical protein